MQQRQQGELHQLVRTLCRKVSFVCNTMLQARTRVQLQPPCGSVGSALLHVHPPRVPVPHCGLSACRRPTNIRPSCLGTRADAQTLSQTDSTPSQLDQEQQSPPEKAEGGYAHVEATCTHAGITVFGMSHLDQQHAAAEWIWQHRPAAVVVETAIDATHGSETGARVTKESIIQAAADFRLRMLLQISSQLAADLGQPSSSSELWQVCVGAAAPGPANTGARAQFASVVRR